MHPLNLIKLENIRQHFANQWLNRIWLQSSLSNLEAPLTQLQVSPDYHVALSSLNLSLGLILKYHFNRCVVTTPIIQALLVLAAEASVGFVSLMAQQFANEVVSIITTLD